MTPGAAVVWRTDPATQSRFGRLHREHAYGCCLLTDIDAVLPRGDGSMDIIEAKWGAKRNRSQRSVLTDLASRIGGRLIDLESRGLGHRRVEGSLATARTEGRLFVSYRRRLEAVALIVDIDKGYDADEMALFFTMAVRAEVPLVTVRNVAGDVWTVTCSPPGWSGDWSRDAFWLWLRDGLPHMSLRVCD